MVTFDAAQLSVLQLDTTQHARVLGAPGTGKTLLLVESFVRALHQPAWADQDVLALAPNRHVATQLRRKIEARHNRALGGTPARTPNSLAFSVLQQRAALEGGAPPMLLTGPVQNEAVAAVISEALEAMHPLVAQLPFAPEVLQSQPFRSELRELDRVIDDFGFAPEELARFISEPPPGAAAPVDEELCDRWKVALRLVAALREKLAVERPGQLSSSAMLAAACSTVLSDERVHVPRLILVDDAAELGEGALALLAALVQRGTRVWVFGDPDTATAAFQGERAQVMSGLHAELRRRGAATRDLFIQEPTVVLQHVYRHSHELRAFVRSLTDRIGAAGVGQQRNAESTRHHAASQVDGPVQFSQASLPAEQLGIIAHRMRSRHLGLQGHAPAPWSEMAVVCRSRAQAKQVARQLSSQQVPTSVTAGGVILREHQIVRELIRLLQHSLDISPLDAFELQELLGGVVGGVDRIAIRRLRAALSQEEHRVALHEQRPSLSVESLMLDAFQLPAAHPVIDMRPARQLRKLGLIAGEASATHRAGGTPREVLWQIWQGSGLATTLQHQALHSRGTRSDEAHRALDAVMGLFFALQRHEEQASTQPIADLLQDLLANTVPEDSVAARSERDVVTVTTPQGLIGREFALVCMFGLQDGEWPNLRSRGSLLGVNALERWLRGGVAQSASKRDTLHDELRLFAHAAARASSELLVVSVANEDHHPSVFFRLGERYLCEQQLPSSSVTLRGVVAKMRRRLVTDPNDREALHALVQIARADVPGAHPDEWYGVMQPSTSDALADVAHDPGATVRVSPSQIERAETCPLDWFVSALSTKQAGYQAGVGTLLHFALETVAEPVSAEELLRIVQTHWGRLRFEAAWQETQALDDAASMCASLAAYLDEFNARGAELVGTETKFEVPIDFVKLSGTADRLEIDTTDLGTRAITVVDLKTGARKPTAEELKQHAQLGAYQLGVISGKLGPIADQAGAKLVYVHPRALTQTQKNKGVKYQTFTQPPMNEHDQEQFKARVLQVGRAMAAAKFTAQVEHHCENPHAQGKSCALHIIPAVNQA